MSVNESEEIERDGLGRDRNREKEKGVRHTRLNKQWQEPPRYTRHWLSSGRCRAQTAPTGWDPWSWGLSGGGGGTQQDVNDIHGNGCGYTAGTMVKQKRMQVKTHLQRSSSMLSVSQARGSRPMRRQLHTRGDCGSLLRQQTGQHCNARLGQSSKNARNKL